MSQPIPIPVTARSSPAWSRPPSTSGYPRRPDLQPTPGSASRGASGRDSGSDSERSSPSDWKPKPRAVLADRDDRRSTSLSIAHELARAPDTTSAVRNVRIATSSASTPQRPGEEGRRDEQFNQLIPTLVDTAPSARSSPRRSASVLPPSTMVPSLDLSSSSRRSSAVVALGLVGLGAKSASSFPSTTPARARASSVDMPMFTLSEPGLGSRRGSNASADSERARTYGQHVRGEEARADSMQRETARIVDARRSGAEWMSNLDRESVAREQKRRSSRSRTSSVPNGPTVTDMGGRPTSRRPRHCDSDASAGSVSGQGPSSEVAHILAPTAELAQQEDKAQEQIEAEQRRIRVQKWRAQQEHLRTTDGDSQGLKRSSEYEQARLELGLPRSTSASTSTSTWLRARPLPAELDEAERVGMLQQEYVIRPRAKLVKPASQYTRDPEKSLRGEATHDTSPDGGVFSSWMLPRDDFLDQGSTVAMSSFISHKRVSITISSATSIASGSSAYVYQGIIEGVERRLVALKVFPSIMKDTERELLYRELTNVSQIALGPGCERILPFLGMAMHGGRMILVSEFMTKGNVLDFLAQSPAASRQQLTLQVAEGVSFLHTKVRLVHGDLKCENVLVNSSGTAVIADFGLSTTIDKLDNTTATGIRHWNTLAFAAPELHLDEAINLPGDQRLRSKTPKSDVYAFGMLVLQAFTGKRPWPKLSGQAILRKVYNGEKPERPGHEITVLGLTDAWWSVCMKCWETSPLDRPSIDTVLVVLQATTLVQVIQHVYVDHVEETSEMRTLTSAPGSPAPSISGSTCDAASPVGSVRSPPPGSPAGSFRSPTPSIHSPTGSMRARSPPKWGSPRSPSDSLLFGAGAPPQDDYGTSQTEAALLEGTGSLEADRSLLPDVPWKEFPQWAKAGRNESYARLMAANRDVEEKYQADVAAYRAEGKDVEELAIERHLKLTRNGEVEVRRLLKDLQTRFLLQRKTEEYEIWENDFKEHPIEYIVQVIQEIYVGHDD